MTNADRQTVAESVTPIESQAAAGSQGADTSGLEKHREFIEMTRFYYRIRRLTQLGDAFFNQLENLMLRRALTRPIDRPIFPLGNFRSGTSLLEKVITDHPSVGSFTYASQVFPRSPYIVGRVMDWFPQLDEPMLPIHLPKPIKSSAPYEAEPIWRFGKNHYWTDSAVNTLDGGYDDPGFAQLFKATINKALAFQGKSRFVNKNPWNTLRIGYLAKLFPDAKFVYIVRHPAQMVRSQLDLEDLTARAWVGMPNFGEAFSDQFGPPRIFFRTRAHGDILRAYAEDKALGIAMSIVDFDQAFDAEVAKAGLEDRILRIRYEDLMTDFESRMNTVFGFLELEPDGASRAIRVNGEQYLDRNLDSWKRKVPGFDAKVTAILQPMLEKYRYNAASLAD